MAYINKDYYVNSYGGSFDGTAEEFDLIADKATDVIDMATMYKITNIDGLAPFIKQQVQKATAAQVEIMQAQGGWQAIVEDQAGASDMGSVRLGAFSYGSGSGASGNLAGMISGTAKSYLAPTGLLYRGVGVRG